MSVSQALARLLRNASLSPAHLGVLGLLALVPLQSACGATGLVGLAVRLHLCLRRREGLAGPGRLPLFPGLPLYALVRLLLPPLLLPLGLLLPPVGPALTRLEARTLSLLAPRLPEGLAGGVCGVER